MAFNVSLITRRIANIKNRRSEIEKVLRNKGIDIEQIENDSLQGKQAFALNKKKLGDLKMACIMDQFTFDSYSPECILFQLSLAGWKEEMEEFQPDLLFIESAWQGKNGEWYRKIANGSEELYLLTNYCKEKIYQWYFGIKRIQFIQILLCLQQNVQILFLQQILIVLESIKNV